MPLTTVSRVCLLFCAFFIVQPGMSQSFSLKLVDEDSGLPIEQAFVFFEHSTIGSSTDEAGQVQFEEIPGSNYKLVLTHILYHDISIPVSEITQEETVVKMTAKDFDLKEVVIASKKVSQAKYKKWFKRFENAFIGDRRVRRKVKILNPRSIWFEEEDGALTVHAIDGLKIRNEQTGYDYTVMLDSCIIEETEDIRFSVKVFFKDILEEVKNQDKVTIQRNELFRQSPLLFFKSLITQHPINREEFEFGFTRRNEEGVMEYRSSSYDQLHWRPGRNADTLLVNGHFTVRIKDVLVKTNIAKGLIHHDQRSAWATSFFYSKSGYIVIHHDGFILNPEDIEESGYWASKRMAHELPRSFQGDVIFKEQGDQPILEDLLDYPDRYQPEKIYLHTDKTTYLPLENMWFKGYLVNGVDHSDRTASKVVYVELWDESNEKVNSWLLHTENGLLGDMQWSPKFVPGTYILRAFTNHMRNQGSEYFFEKEITLMNLSSDIDSTVSRSLKTYCFILS